MWAVVEQTQVVKIILKKRLNSLYWIYIHRFRFRSVCFDPKKGVFNTYSHNNMFLNFPGLCISPPDEFTTILLQSVQFLEISGENEDVTNEDDKNGLNNTMPP